VIFIGLTIGIAIGALVGYLLAARSGADTASRLNAAEAAVELKEELLRTQAENHERQIELIRADRKQLSEEMSTISGEVLTRTSKQLSLEMAERQKLEREQARNELEKRTVEIKTAVTPVTEKLAEVQQKVDSLEKDRVKAQGELGEQLKNLQAGVANLADQAGGLSAALRKPQGRGSWGEVQLTNVIELAGMVEHCDFVSQTAVEGDNGRLIPDVVVNMPGGKSVVIDAKSPMEAFLEAQEETDEEKKSELLQQHARQVRNHVNTLRTKRYQDQFEHSPELVVMFLPSEGLYFSALSEDSKLLEDGLKENVLIATPTTLIGLLRAIYYGWGQDKIARSAQEIAEAGRELHKRVLNFAEPLAKVGKSLNSATVSYNKAIGSYESRVVPQLRKIEGAGAKSSKEISTLEAIETSSREIVIDTSAVEEDFEEDLELVDLELVEPAGEIELP
jgi:DNA recombination protein RmuC